jgi:UDP-2,4-diacetamido-2,4,6-trideoxy-beta-L-altropyranose hydrolase
MRCLTLADAFQNNKAQILFVCRDHQGHLKLLIEDRGYPVALLSGSDGAFTNNEKDYAQWLGVSQSFDAGQTLSVIYDHFELSEIDNIDLVIVDHYALDSDWEDEIYHCTHRLMVIDDLVNRKHHADFLLNQTPGFKPERYANIVNDDCEFLLGADYALIRPEFLALRSHCLEERISRSKHTNVSNLLIALGGVDEHNLSLRIVELIQKLFSTMTTPELTPLNIQLVLGKGAPHFESVMAYAEALSHSRFSIPGISLEVLTGINNLHELMAQADLAIGSAGTTAWERCVLGLPTLLIISAENQQMNADILCASGAAILLDVFHTNEEELIEKIRSALTDAHWRTVCSSAAARLCDGQGVNRAVHRLSINPVVGLRLAQNDDMHRILEWQNEEGARQYCRNPSKIALDEHKKWFSSKLEDDNTRLFIITLSDKSIGMLRLDIVSNTRHAKEIEVSLIVSSKARGSGVGVAAVEASKSEYLKWTDQLKWQPKESRLIAEVLHPNKVSKQLFLSAGFISYDVTESGEWFYWQP